MTAETTSPEALREEVRTRYAHLATIGGSCCSSSTCTSGGDELGYDARELAELPSGANLGLGCGHPAGVADLRAGETVLDLGSGAGIDCFLAARRVGPRGSVIGVDMTPEMVGRARAAAARADYPNVEFRLGEVEHLPVADASVDVVISNCVLNLVPDQAQAYREAFRALRPGGRVVVADVVVTQTPADGRPPSTDWAGCAAGARAPAEIAKMLRSTGFVDVSVEVVDVAARTDPCCGTSSGLASASVRATKPGLP
jgi:arsenite methyltransferase